MKKMITLIAVLLLTMSMAGCKTSEQPSDPANDITSSVTPVTDTNTDKNAEVTSAPTAAPTAEPTAAPDNTPTLAPDAGDYNDAATSYYHSESTELVNTLIEIFPVDDTTAVFQIEHLNAAEDIDIPVEINCAYSFTKVNRATYTYSAADSEDFITAYINTDGQITLTSNIGSLSNMVGTYYPSDGYGYLEPETILEYLRHIPAANIGDFNPNDQQDVFEESVINEWFHQIQLFRGGKLTDTLLVADDLSAVCRVENDTYKLIYGSFESMVNFAETYDVYNEDDDTYTPVTFEIVYAYIENGPELIEGMTSAVAVEAPIDMTESLVLSSSDTSVLDINGTDVIAKAPGEAVLTASFVFGGFAKTSEINVVVTANDPNNEIIFDSLELEKYTTYYDKISQRAVLEICNEDGICGVDILWGDSADTIHHWSYIGTMDENGNMTLIGNYFIETTNEDGTLSDNFIFENVGATITLGEDGCYYWHDDYADAGKDCIFELPE